MSYASGDLMSYAASAYILHQTRVEYAKFFSLMVATNRVRVYLHAGYLAGRNLQRQQSPVAAGRRYLIGFRTGAPRRPFSGITVHGCFQ